MAVLWQDTSVTEGDPTRDEPNSQVIPYKDNEIILKRKDPYGFIHVSLKRGALPRNLKDSVYTTYASARKAVQAYLETNEINEYQELEDDHGSDGRSINRKQLQRRAPNRDDQS